jgi:hypothetical protein
MAVIGYTDNAEALAYIQLRYDTSITQIELDRALYLAFDKIEGVNIRYTGKENGINENNFPRICDDEVPENVVKAQILEAYEIAIGGDSDISKITRGIKSRSISDMSVSYDSTLKVGLINFASTEAAKIMKMYERKTFGSRMEYAYKNN